MQVHIKREESEKGFFGKKVFILKYRVELTEEEKSAINGAGINDYVLYQYQPLKAPDPDSKIAVYINSLLTGDWVQQECKDAPRRDTIEKDLKTGLETLKSWIANYEEKKANPEEIYEL